MDNQKFNPPCTHFLNGTPNNAALPPVSAFSAYNNLLRNCNYLLSSQATETNEAIKSPTITGCSFHPSSATSENLETDKFLPPKIFLSSTPLANYSSQQFQLLQNDQFACYNTVFRRQRGEKRPIPEEQKDEKYFERRRRNNQAAKKSRDARKLREDQIALKATILEHENAILRAQVFTLKEETSSLRQMLLQKKALEMFSRNS